MDASALQQMHTGQKVKIVAATVAGNMIEFYDFLVYSFFAVYIGKTFFPSDNEWVSLLSALAVFGVGFVTRPIGGVLIGMFADRAGRRPALLLTIFLITVGTLGLALTPSYAQIGIAAPIIVVTCRLIQGFALGGEVGPASSFLVEIAPAGKRGLYGSWQVASQGLAILVSGLIGYTLTVILTEEQLYSWGWRLPFIIGLLLIPVALFLRRAMPETVTTVDEVEGGKLSDLTPYVRLILIGIFVILAGTVSIYVSNYMTTYAIKTLELPGHLAMLATVSVGVAGFIGGLLGGLLSDKHGRRMTMMIPRFLILIFIIPMFSYLVSHPSLGVLIAVTFTMTFLTYFSFSVTLVAIPELLPKRIRALGLSVVYAFGVAIFGGSTQFVVAYFQKLFDIQTFPAYYVAITSLITLIAMCMLPEGKNRALED